LGVVDIVYVEDVRTRAQADQRRREMLRGVRSVRTGRISRGINIPRGRGGRGGEERTVVVETLYLGLEWQKRGCGETGDTAKYGSG
jgi:hypothetical protein